MRWFCGIWKGGSRIIEHCSPKMARAMFEIFGGSVVPISRKGMQDTVMEHFLPVDMDPNQDTGAWAEVWWSSCCPNASIIAPRG